MDRRSKNLIDIMCDVSSYLNIILLAGENGLTGDGPITWGIGGYEEDGKTGKVIESELTNRDVIMRFIEKAVAQGKVISVGAGDNKTVIQDKLTGKTVTQEYDPLEEGSLIKAILINLRNIYREEKKSFEEQMGTKKDE